MGDVASQDSTQKCGRISSFGIAVPFPLLVSSDLDVVATDIHTAPAARILLARVVEAYYARFTLTKTTAFRVAVKIGGGVDNGCRQICRFLQLEVRLPECVSRAVQ